MRKIIADYTASIKYLFTPGQNIAFACKNGDIAMTAQGAISRQMEKTG